MRHVEVGKVCDGLHQSLEDLAVSVSVRRVHAGILAIGMCVVKYIVTLVRMPGTTIDKSIMAKAYVER